MFIQQAFSATTLLDRIGALRSGGKQFGTNLFAGPQVLAEWIVRGELAYLDASTALLIIRCGIGVLHLYHAVSDPGALSTALNQLNTLELKQALAVDLVGRAEMIVQVGDVYAAYGFSFYRKLVRMSRTEPGALTGAVCLCRIERADRSRVELVWNFLVSVLDPYSEQIPGLEDLCDAADKREILCVVENGTICGVLIFRRTGLSCLLRYWFVAPAMQGCGIGAALMRAFLTEAACCSRILLWVFSDNAASIAKYRHYGFKIDVLEDWIMLKMPRRR